VTARSWLYAPAHRAELVAKALAGPADAVVLDLEDAVPPAAKDRARDGVAEALRTTPTPRSTPVWVRVNALDGSWGADDLDVLAELTPDGIRLPKATDPEAVAAVADRLGRPLHLLLESALGVERAFPLVTAHPLVVGVSLGEADLAADLGVTDPAALTWARQRIVVANRAADRPGPIAAVWTDVADLDGLVADSRAAHAAGFTGRSVIHPRQIEPVHRAFTPTDQELAAARALLGSVSAEQAAGRAAWIDADGRFVDAAVVARARRLLDRATHFASGSERP
jgi:citrate lyase subunit beta/citryl-CoA lyase